MPILPIINQSGPIPISANFLPPTDAPATIYVAGSVWSQQTNVMIGITITLDGVIIGTAQIFSNGNATHRAVVPVLIPVQLTFGNHTLSLSGMTSETVSDSNDFFTAVLMY